MEASLFPAPYLSYSLPVRLVDFLICLLEAHAQTLQRLAALYGEDVLFEILEQAGDSPQARSQIDSSLFSQTSVRGVGVSGSAYAELESAVHGFKLPAVLEFHLWAYPHYRAFVESPIDLNSRIPGPGTDTASVLVEEAVAQAKRWVKQLPIPPELGQQTERAAEIPWLRFRTTVLKRVGRRPMGTVY
ncbi:MAG: hypothetical protein A2603_16590 [Bdellovibrionales bacterium RIFOXYD1_FULL_55_31]|nr:MAG: hypothetical protein A2603_16590 [Bdellovibrionales bacterium RIFOXYD1_FULL_55_31]